MESSPPSQPWLTTHLALFLYFFLHKQFVSIVCLPSFCHFDLQFDRLTLCFLSSIGLQLYNTH
ncbi:hypothetical protein V6Z11_D01G046700 [Gossypium hirsutum]